MYCLVIVFCFVYCLHCALEINSTMDTIDTIDTIDQTIEKTILHNEINITQWNEYYTMKCVLQRPWAVSPVWLAPVWPGPSTSHAGDAQARNPRMTQTQSDGRRRRRLTAPVTAAGRAARILYKSNFKKKYLEDFRFM